MTTWEAMARLAGNTNLALASATALGWLPSPPWVMQLLFWPAVVTIPIWAVAVVDIAFRGRK